jgi:hypothetical protein
MTRLQKISDNCKFDEYLCGRALLLDKRSDLKKKNIFGDTVTKGSLFLNADMSTDFEQTLTNTGWFTEKNK